MNICLQCNSETKNKKFCSRSCSASYNNKGVRRHGKEPGKCKECGDTINRCATSYCSNSCQQLFQLRKRIASGKFSAKSAKQYLLHTEGNICSCCNLSVWNNKPIPIEIGHIDGNPLNNSLSNLRLICPNCHAQTDTY